MTVPMTERYRWSSIIPDDAAAWAELTNHLAVADGTEEFYDAEDRAEELDAPDLNPRKDTLAVWDAGVMVGFGTVSVPTHRDHEGRARIGIDGGVHTHHRKRGIGTALMEQLEARGRELASHKHPGHAFHYDTGGGLSESSARAFHLRRGYETARHFHLMTRPLTGDDSAQNILTRPTPEDIALRAPASQDEQAVMEAHTAAFADHWGSAPPSPERWHSKWTSRTTRRDFSRIAVDPRGVVCAYALCSQWVEGELYVELLGTVPDARGQGLGTAVLAHVIEAGGRSSEYQTIELDVDSESLTGATKLYERIGFTVKNTTALMRKHGL